MAASSPAMQHNIASVFRSFFARRSGATPISAGGKPNPSLATLSMPTWAGHRARHRVHLIDRQDESAVVWSPEYVDVGETVWIEAEQDAVKCSVQAYTATGGGYRLVLSLTTKSRRFKERLACDHPGDLEWVEGLTRVRCPVRVTNETTDGVQLTLSRPAPEIRSVRLQYDGRTEIGTVRYCIPVGVSYLVGVEFV